MNNKEPGYVYILTNPSFREDWVKIGKWISGAQLCRFALRGTVPIF